MGIWGKWGWLGILAVTMTGCARNELNLKPPPRPEVFATPPVEDARFSKPIQYPQDTLNLPPLKKSSPQGGPGGAGGGPRFGGQGMGR